MKLEQVQQFLLDGLLVADSCLSMTRRQAVELLKATDGHKDLERGAQELISNLDKAADSIRTFHIQLQKHR